MSPRSYRTGRQDQQSKTPKQQGRIERVLNLRVLIFIIGIVLLGRLFYLQVIQHSHYEQLARAEHQKKFTLPASRGTLYFRDGDQVVPAVLNSTIYTLYADPTTVNNVDDTARYIASTLKLDQGEVKKQLTRQKTAYSVIAKRLNKDQVEALFKDKERLKGVNITPVPQRVYPEGELGAQILGFVNDEGVGQYGVEGKLNTTLEGKPGTLSAVTDVRGVPLSLDDATNIAQAPQDGQDTILTIDRNIQAQAELALKNGLEKSGATKGSVVVLDPSTGAVRAMANMPTYNPGKYFEVGSDAYERFRNRVVSDPYEAGSVIKVLTMAAGLDSGAVTKDSSFHNAGFIQIDDARIRNVEQSVNGGRSMTDVLKFSLNTGVIHVLQQMGGGSLNLQARERLYQYFTERYGFGGLTGIEQIGEATGSIYGPRTVQGNNVRYSNMSFGQGMDVTMIQTVAAFAAVLNNGDYFQPHIVEGAMQEDGSLTSQQPKPERTGVVSPAASAALREMTRASVSETPVINNLLTPGYWVGGKTGTSQVIDQATGRYADTNAIGSYLGYAADTKPRYVIMVRVDDSKLPGFAGTTVAAPIFAELNNWLLNYYNVKPQ